jgi:SAM-dependent methyltransferase
MANRNRWKLAQSYEKSYWQSNIDEDYSYYEDFAIALIKDIVNHLKLDSDSSILEVGSGAAGIINYLPGNKRCSIDPLEDYYSTVEEFVQVRDPEVEFKSAQGESIPYNDSSFDLIIIDNVLDHCEDPSKVMSEIGRVIRSGGYIYFRQNIFTSWGKFTRFCLELFKIDRGHPFTFREQDLDSLLKSLNFEIVENTKNGYLQTWFRELTSGKLKPFLRSLLLSPRDTILYIAKHDKIS